MTGAAARAAIGRWLGQGVCLAHDGDANGAVAPDAAPDLGRRRHARRRARVAPVRAPAC